MAWSERNDSEIHPISLESRCYDKGASSTRLPAKSFLPELPPLPPADADDADDAALADGNDVAPNTAKEVDVTTSNNAVQKSSRSSASSSSTSPKRRNKKLPLTPHEALPNIGIVAYIPIMSLVIL
jgi:hypothetical protein